MNFLLQGYYSFSQKLKHVVRLPFAIMAYGNFNATFALILNISISKLTPFCSRNCIYAAFHGLETICQRSSHFNCAEVCTFLFYIH